MNKNFNNQMKKNEDKHLPSMFPDSNEKNSNIKIYGNQPIVYKDSPFYSRKDKRRELVKKDGPLNNKRNKIEKNSKFSEDHSENLNKNKKMNEIINYISEPYYNKNYKKLKTQPNVQPKMNFNKNKYNNNNNNQISQTSNTLNLVNNNNQENKQNYPPSKKKIYKENISYKSDCKAIPEENNYNNLPQLENPYPKFEDSPNSQRYQQNNNNYNNLPQIENPYPEFTETLNQNKVQHKIHKNQKNSNEKSSKRRDDPRNTHHGKKKNSRKVKVEIAKTEPNYKYYDDEYENGLKYINESYSKRNFNETDYKLNNTPFNNRTINIKNYNKRYISNPNKDYNNISAKIDPKILEQYTLIKEIESNEKIKELERQKEKLRK